MTKIVYIDIGTHFGQEFNSIFGSEKYFYVKFFRRFIGYYLFKKGKKVTLTYFVELKNLRKKIKKIKKDFLFFFVEANSKIISSCNVYKKVNGVFNCALTGEEKLSVKKLFLAHRDILGVGSSIFSNKHNVSINDFVPTLGVPSKLFFEELKKHIDKITVNYHIVCRLNCEGVEDDVIYAIHKIFKKKLTLVMGSLKDVKGCKGEVAYVNLYNFLKNNSLPFVTFTPDVSSWKEAHIAIKQIHEKNVLCIN